MSVEHITLNGLAAVKLTHPSGATATVYVYGAHVASWKSADGHENMFVSSKTVFGDGKAIRGGVPVCFPQFAARGAYQKHGFCRNSAEWTVVRTSTEPYPCVVLGLTDSPATKELWPFAFKLRYSVTLDSDASLSMSLAVMNSGDQPIEFTTALHTYLAVNHLDAVSLHGQAQEAEWDAVRDTHQSCSGVLKFDTEFDRVYDVETQAQPTWTLHEGSNSLQILQSTSWGQSVVWNPGAEKCSQLKDMPKDAYQRMLCVEAASVTSSIQVQPAQTWTGWQSFTL